MCLTLQHPSFIPSKAYERAAPGTRGCGGDGKATKLGELAQNLFEKQLDLYSLSLTLLFE